LQAKLSWAFSHTIFSLPFLSFTSALLLSLLLFWFSSLTYIMIFSFYKIHVSFFSFATVEKMNPSHAHKCNRTKEEELSILEFFFLLGEPSRWFFYVEFSLFVTLNKKILFFHLSIAHFVVKATQKRNVNYHGMCVCMCLKKFKYIWCVRVWRILMALLMDENFKREHEHEWEK